MTNQALRGKNAIAEWKKKIPLIAASVRALCEVYTSIYESLEQLSGIPFRIFAATAKDGYRKPMPGIWYEVERIFSADRVNIGAGWLSL